MAVAYYSIDHTLIDSDLTNFPVGVKIESSTGFMSGLGSTDWQNLHATVGGSECYVEVEFWDTSNEVAVLWIQVPTVSSSADTVIKIETGTANTSYVGETGDTAAQSVWNSNFVAVYHLAQDPSGGTDCILDSTSNENHGTPTGSMVSGDLIDGQIGKAIDFDGSDDGIDSANNIGISGSQNRTILVSFKTSNSSGYLPVLTWGVTSTGLLFSLACDGSSTLRLAVSGGNRLFSAVYADYNWHRIAIVLDGTATDDLSCFFDGSAATVSSTSSVTLDTTDSPLEIGKTTSYNFIGQIDEVQIVNTNLPDAWLKADYHNFTNTLLTYSATDPSGGAIEPDLPTQGVGFSGTAGGHVAVKNIGLEAGIGFGVEAGAELSGQGSVQAGIGFDETLGRSIDVSRGIVAGIGFGATAGASLERNIGVDAALGIGATAGAVNYSAWLRKNRHLATYRYYSKITSVADGLSDYPMPGLKSFQFRMRSGDPSYLSLVFVYTSTLLSAISARENGEIVLDMVAVVDGEESLREELIRAPFYSVRYDRGAKSQSLTLVGYQTREYGGARVELENVTTERMLADGRIQFRCARPDFYLRPGDTAVHGGNEFIVDSISSLVSPTSQYMDVAE